ncbi:hypothetical protein PGTUg99_000019, partial [Puccinia graminis f. sp. tritici]
MGVHCAWCHGRGESCTKELVPKQALFRDAKLPVRSGPLRPEPLPGVACRSVRPIPQPVDGIIPARRSTILTCATFEALYLFGDQRIKLSPSLFGGGRRALMDVGRHGTGSPQGTAEPTGTYHEAYAKMSLLRRHSVNLVMTVHRHFSQLPTGADR